MDADALIRSLRDLEAKIEKMLDRQAVECYGVDVREKYQSTSPVIQTVVNASDAMHDLLFIRLDLKAVLEAAVREPPAAPPAVVHSPACFKVSRLVDFVDTTMRCTCGAEREA